MSSRKTPKRGCGEIKNGKCSVTFPIESVALEPGRKYFIKAEFKKKFRELGIDPSALEFSVPGNGVIVSLPRNTPESTLRKLGRISTSGQEVTMRLDFVGLKELEFRGVIDGISVVFDPGKHRPRSGFSFNYGTVGPIH